MKKFLFFLVSCVTWATVTRAEFYLFNDLGTTGPYTYLGATGINKQGDVVGTAYESSGPARRFSL